IYQFVAVSVLTPFGFSKTDAIAYILLAQAVQYALITFWGALGMARSPGIRLRQAIREDGALPSSIPGEVV
ncbi:MAG: hypothetical protein JO210_14000, partial [Acidobacteriaceae bacterium]|nr:hypothetical protein [Acidobacteriaceae bacterium]